MGSTQISNTRPTPRPLLACSTRLRSNPVIPPVTKARRWIRGSNGRHGIVSTRCFCPVRAVKWCFALHTIGHCSVVTVVANTIGKLVWCGWTVGMQGTYSNLPVLAKFIRSTRNTHRRSGVRLVPRGAHKHAVPATAEVVHRAYRARGVSSNWVVESEIPSNTPTVGLFGW